MFVTYRCELSTSITRFVIPIFNNKDKVISL